MPRSDSCFLFVAESPRASRSASPTKLRRILPCPPGRTSSTTGKVIRRTRRLSMMSMTGDVCT